jgi:hypothetical protein
MTVATKKKCAELNLYRFGQIEGQQVIALIRNWRFSG